MRLVVVGSGIVGASCAFAASRLGAEVVLVDAGLPGQATAAGAGIVCPWWPVADDQVWYDFACASARQYPGLVGDLAELGEADVGYRRTGALVLTASPELQEEARRLLLARRAAAPEIAEVAALTGAEACELFPPLRPDLAAVFIGGGGRVDGRLLAGALARAASRRGAVIRAGRAELMCRSGHVKGVALGGEIIEADVVVAATGAWTTAFLEPAGVAVAVTPQRGQITHIGMEPADTSRWPVVLPGGSAIPGDDPRTPACHPLGPTSGQPSRPSQSSTGHYLLAFDGSRVVAGATRESGAGFDHRVTPAGLSEVLREALAVAPGLAGGTYLETRVGFRPVGPDERPLLGPVPGVEGLVLATGLGHSGLTMGPHAGAIAARVALGEPPGLDLAPLNPLRASPETDGNRPLN